MNKIYIVGLPGAGKTKLGRDIAIKLQWDFLDIDEEIERTEGKKIAEIFEKEGESAFRKLEKQVLADTARLSHTVISCGGGTPAFSNNMEWMIGHGLTLFLNTSVETIVQRIAANTENRPLFRGLDEAGIRKMMAKIVDERGYLYSKARIVWNRTTPGGMLYRAIDQLLSLNLVCP